MYPRHDEQSGQWFKQDMDGCAACYLNNSHSYAKHIQAIAEQRTLAEMKIGYYELTRSNELEYRRRLAAQVEAVKAEQPLFSR